MASPSPILSFRSIPQGAALVQTSHFTFEKTGSHGLRLRVITHLLSGDACKDKHSASQFYGEGRRKPGRLRGIPEVPHQKAELGFKADDSPHPGLFWDSGSHPLLLRDSLRKGS